MEQELIEINFNEVEVKDLDGNVLQITDFAKVAANGIFISAPTIELSDFARQLHKGGSVKIDKDSLNIMIAIFKNKQIFMPFAQIPLIEYLDSKLARLDGAK